MTLREMLATAEVEVKHTPLVRLRRITRSLEAELWVKVEAASPAGSVKDRVVRAALAAAAGDGRLEGRTVLGGGSAGTAAAVAVVCAERGLPCEFCLPPAGVPQPLQRLLGTLGLALVWTDAAEGRAGARQEARRRAAASPERYFLVDPATDPAAVEAHYRTTAAEIWEQTDGRVTHFVAGIGSGATITGTGRRLRELRSDIRVIGVEPAPGERITSLARRDEAGAGDEVPALLDPEVADVIAEVTAEEAAGMARRVVREEGIQAGASGGANVAAALRLAAGWGSGALVVTLLPNGGERRLLERWWEEVVA
jgi:cysteine synthase